LTSSSNKHQPSNRWFRSLLPVVFPRLDYIYVSLWLWRR
jgi:hypothetical protein